MGREIRRVPADWDHPKNDDGSFHPLYDEYYGKKCEEWYAECIKAGGKHVTDEGEVYWFHDWDGNPPNKEYYRDRDWTAEEATHIQMYETVSEGTPVSPVFATKQELVGYLCEHGDFWDQKRRNDKSRPFDFGMPCDPWTRQNAEHFVNSEWACSGIIANGSYYGPSTQGVIEEARPAPKSAPEDTAEARFTACNTPNMQLAEPVVE
jgi:hypothetical protein